MDPLELEIGDEDPREWDDVLDSSFFSNSMETDDWEENESSWTLSSEHTLRDLWNLSFEVINY